MANKLVEWPSSVHSCQSTNSQSSFGLQGMKQACQHDLRHSIDQIIKRKCYCDITCHMQCILLCIQEITFLWKNILMLTVEYASIKKHWSPVLVLHRCLDTALIPIVKINHFCYFFSKCSLSCVSFIAATIVYIHHVLIL